MLKAIRYTLAAICLAASMGCLALWWRSMSNRDFFTGPSLAGRVQCLQFSNGRVIYRPPDKYVRPGKVWRSNPISDTSGWDQYGSESFGRRQDHLYFPLWFPALVFALAAVAAMRVGRQFTLRSALVGMSVVAALLGMVVAL